MDRDNTLIMNSYFDFLYAKAICQELPAVLKHICEGCVHGKLSQTKHDCMTLTQLEQLEYAFDDIVKVIDENSILMKWEESVACIDIPKEVLALYRLKVYCKDWRETDMKTPQWRQRMISLSSQILELENRF